MSHKNKTGVATLVVTLGIIGIAALWGVLGRHGAAGGTELPAAAAAPVQTAVYQPPLDSEIPKGKFGDEVRLGQKIFEDPGKYATAYVGNTLQCVNCHLAKGRQAGSAPFGAAYLAYPAYRSKNGHVNTFEERLQGCFRFSMNGKAPPLGSQTLVALETYAYFLAKGGPTGVSVPARGFPALPAPKEAPDYVRGAQVYGENCAICHAANGQGKLAANGQQAFPPLWGPKSFNWGAGMGSVQAAAEFIRANMPLGLGGTLTPQQAWDVAMYVDSQVRPQDPRFTGDVAQTRKKFHDSKWSMYGKTVNGALLGDPATTPPAGTVPVSYPAPTKTN